MHILAIETSCDETSVAVLKGNLKNSTFDILANVIASQIAIHKEWGGVVPNLAAREHLKNIVPVIEKALSQSKIKLSQIDLFAVTQGPGLIPALLIGTNSAKTLSFFQKKPLLGIHHIEGHIYANLASLKSKQQQLFPLLALVVSGGHTQLIRMKDHFKYKIVGQTQDDAVGEAFDKVARILELGYPGGPVVSKRADRHKENMKKITDGKLKEKLEVISFPRPMIDTKDYNFSFSGLKTAVLYFAKKVDWKKLSAKQGVLFKDAICHEFQEAVIDVLAKKTIKATKEFSPKTVLLAGGVAANKKLSKTLGNKIKKNSAASFASPPLELCGDNAAMIAIAAFYRFKNLKKNSQKAVLGKNWKILQADSNLPLKNS